jgi:hypothetical protein
MRPFLIVTLDPAIKIDLEIGDRAVDLLAKGDAIELIEHRLMEPLDDAIRLRAHSIFEALATRAEAPAAMMVMFTIAAIYAPMTADVDVECPLQTAAVELALGRRPACGRQKGRPAPAAQSRSASLPMGHQPQPRLRRPFWEGDANGGSVRRHAFDDTSLVHRDDGVDEIAAECPEPRKRAVFVHPGEPAIAGDVRHQNRCEFARLRHGSLDWREA